MADHVLLQSDGRASRTVATDCRAYLAIADLRTVMVWALLSRLLTHFTTVASEHNQHTMEIV